MGSGSEVTLVARAQQALGETGVRARAVSMPSWELFEAQPTDYQEAVLPRHIRCRLAVEAAVPLGWERWLGPVGGVIGVERYGASAPGDVTMREYGFTVDGVLAQARALLER